MSALGSRYTSCRRHSVLDTPPDVGTRFSIHLLTSALELTRGSRYTSYVSTRFSIHLLMSALELTNTLDISLSLRVMHCSETKMDCIEKFDEVLDMHSDDIGNWFSIHLLSSALELTNTVDISLSLRVMHCSETKMDCIEKFDEVLDMHSDDIGNWFSIHLLSSALELTRGS